MIPPSARPDRWSGIVKIHGSLTTQDKSQGELVLSRGDFGRAYLEEGWARRFIVDIFTHFHVLFIVFSLNDPMVRYIADAYALGRQNNNMHNKQAYIFLADYKEAYTRGIKVIKYIKCNDSSEPHEDLYNKLNILAKYNDEPYEKIKVIENFRKYPNDPKEHEILVKHLATDPKTISFFFRFKRYEAGTIADIKWLEYFTTNNVKLPIINEDLDAIKHSENNPNHHLISYWLCQHLDKAEFIDWLVKNNGIIHPILRTHLSRELKNYISSPYYKIISLLMNNIIFRSDYNYSDDNNVLIYLKQEIEQLHKCGQLEIIDAGLKLRILHALKPQTTINYDPNYRKDQYEQPEQAFLGMISLKIQDDSIRELKQLLETANIIADIAQELIYLLKQYCEIEFLLNPSNSKSYSKVKSIGDDELDNWYNLNYLVELVRDSIKSQ